MELSTHYTNDPRKTMELYLELPSLFHQYILCCVSSLLQSQLDRYFLVFCTVFPKDLTTWNYEILPYNLADLFLVKHQRKKVLYRPNLTQKLGYVSTSLEEIAFGLLTLFRSAYNRTS